MLAPAHDHNMFLGLDTDRFGMAGVLLGAAVRISPLHNGHKLFLAV